jgi:hypothetical protein
MQVKPGQRHDALAADTLGSTLWIDRRQTGIIHCILVIDDFCPRSASGRPAVISL